MNNNKRLSFLFLRLVDASSLSTISRSQEVFFVLVIFKDITKVNINATFSYLSKRFVILSFQPILLLITLSNQDFGF